MPFQSKKHHTLAALFAAAICAVLLFHSGISFELFGEDTTVQKIVGCFATKGQRVNAAAVRDWINEFRDRYGESDADARLVAERVACRYR